MHGLRIVMLFLSAASLTGCRPAAEPIPREKMPIAVSSSYIEAAVKDLLGDNTPLYELTGPGMCPGHFDIRPSQIEKLARCRLLVRFDFQEGLEKKLAGRNGDKTAIVAIAPPGGLCVPETYLAVCRQLADHFSTDGTLSKTDGDARLKKIAQRFDELKLEADKAIEAAGLSGAAVMCSQHQSDFCRWLGLKVISEFPSADSASTGGIDQAINDAESAGVRLIVANEPEGRRAADALADRLDARVVVFANFPEPGKKHAFDAMVRKNISALTKDVARQSRD